MKQFAIIGLDVFGQSLLEELTYVDCEILIIDKSREVIEFYKEQVSRAFVADAINEEIINRLIPKTIDTAVVDLGGRIEVSVLVTNYLKKMGIPVIIARAESEEHGEILSLVGATRVVFPNREAAKRIAPMMISSFISSYIPLSANFVIAEVRPPSRFVGKTLIELNLRQEHELNVIAVSKEHGEDYNFFSPDYILQEDDIFLIAGTEENLSEFAQINIASQNRKKVKGLFRKLFDHLR